MILLKLIFFVKIINISNGWHHSIEYNFKINTTDIENDQVKMFESVYSSRDYFQLLSSNRNNNFDIDDLSNPSILIGARNYLYQLKLPELDIISNQTWTSSQIDTINCLNRSIISNKDECDNYIKLYLKINENVFKICSTNALNPKCRFYGLKNIDSEFSDKKFEKSYIINETSGIGQAPLKAYESKYAYNFVNERLYTANSIDLNRFFTSINGLYDQDRISTNVDDNNWINRADFVSTFTNDNRIFFIFNEDATNLDDNSDFRAPQRISQIAHVCQNDRGAPLNSLRNIWTTYLKAKLSCVYDPSSNSAFIPETYSPTYQKSSLFYFDEIKSVSDLFTDTNGNQYFYGVFTTSTNTITASAVCKFSMDQIMDSFHGDYKIKSLNPNFDESEKINRLRNSVPNPRPSECPNELTYQHLIFSRKNFIMEKEILSHAVIVESSVSDRFASIDVDYDINSKDLLLIGTDNGRVLNFVLKDNELVYSEELEIFKKNLINFKFSQVPNELKFIPSHFSNENKNEIKSSRISNIKLFKKESKNFIIIMTQNKLFSIKADFCNQKILRRTCDQNLYPYCQWSERHSKCFSSSIDPNKIPLLNKTIERSEKLIPVKKFIMNYIDLKNETNSSKISKSLDKSNEINLKINIHLFVFVIVTFIAITLFMCVFIIVKILTQLITKKNKDKKLGIQNLNFYHDENGLSKSIDQSYPTSQPSTSPFEISSTISYTSTKSTKSSILSTNRNGNQSESRYVYLKSKCQKPFVLNVNELCVQNDDEHDFFGSIDPPKFMTSKSTTSSFSSRSLSQSSLSNKDNYLSVLKSNIETNSLKQSELSRKSSLCNSISNHNRYYL
ncbi:unnamed protein product [Brachionus calyciflorus]|uniref:Sema domain-containing protein n=1 Tax=Brachionus calyciflorus TaxID=104777 RepID=A0A813MXQ6_9BILA|nr:unnamed protein product [Brachionus calyciflorus]